jgi:hypothetical protein
MSLTLEQLDQFGALDTLPFSLDNNWTDEGVCGPFNLDTLDAFGSIDTLGFSLDDNIWTLTTTCSKVASAEVTGTGTLTATADFRLPITVEASITGVGLLAADAFLVRLAEGSITGFGSLTSSVVRIQGAEASVSGSGSLSSSVTRILEAIRQPMTITEGGDITNSATQSKFGSQSIYCDNFGDYLEISPVSTYQDFMKLGNEFTHEMWVYPTANRNISLIEARTSSTLLMGVYGIYLPVTDNFAMTLLIGNTTIYSTLVTPKFEKNTWNHIVIQRESNKRPQLIVNGTYYPSSPTIDNNDWAGLETIRLLGFPGTFGLGGYVNEIRTSNVRRYPTYTTPTAPFDPDGNTLLLIHGDGDIADDNGRSICVGTGSLSASAIRTATVEGGFSGAAYVTALAGFTAEGTAQITGSGAVTATLNAISSIQAQVNGVASIISSLYVFGEEWSQVADEANTWSTVPAEGNTWAAAMAGANTWSTVAAGSNTWTTTTVEASEWL